MSEKKIKPAYGWGIIWKGEIWVGFVKWYKWEAISYWIDGTNETWKQWYSKGARCVKVEIKAVGK